MLHDAQLQPVRSRKPLPQARPLQPAWPEPVPPAAPAHRPPGLSRNTGVVANSPPMPYRSAPHTAQLENVPSTRPIGTAILHQLSASIRTKRTTCCLLIPRQRIIPKNRVRCAILLFMRRKTSIRQKKPINAVNTALFKGSWCLVGV